MTHLSEAILNDTKGISITLSDPAVAQTAKDKFDFIVLDATTRDFSTDLLRHFILAANGKPVLVRVSDLSTAYLQRYLNENIDGLILANIQHAGDVEKALAACLYPPEGVRPFIGAPGDIALQAMNDQLTLIVEIAQPTAVAQIEDIVEVTGVNGVLLSPRKLAVAMERGFNTDHSDVQQAIKAVVQVAQNVELPWGIEGLWSGQLDPRFAIACSDVELLQYGMDSVVPVIEEDEQPSGLRAMR